jgi:Holliday junction resolvase RusA-like endonuclease
MSTQNTQLFSVPIRLEVGVNKKKTHYLNLNGYRNWQFQLNNQLKKLFKITVAKDIRQLQPIEGKCKISYTIYYPTKRAFDIDNIGSVITKFTNDALVEFGILVDDNYNYVTELVFKFGGVDKDNPRCDVELEEVKDD